MPKPLFVWCTETVDTSAVQLAQMLDGECIKNINDDVDIDSDNIIFFGNVPLDGVLTFNKKNMFNNPGVGHAIRNKKTFLEKLAATGVNVPKMTVVAETTTFTKAQQNLGTTGKLDMIEKGTMKVLACVENAAQFNSYKASSAYARKHVNAAKLMRVFFGNQNVLGHSVIGMSYTEFRMLTFKETLKMGRSAEVQAQIDDMFEKNLLNEAAGTGTTAWTDMTYLDTKVNSLDVIPWFTDAEKNLINKVYASMNSMFADLDFFAVDITIDNTGSVMVTNVTTSPSLQNIDILTFVADYFKHLLSFGRISIKEKLNQKIKTLSMDKIKKLLETLEADEQAA